MVPAHENGTKIGRCVGKTPVWRQSAAAGITRAVGLAEALAVSARPGGREPEGA